jgi:acetoin utilization protein AcuB
MQVQQWMSSPVITVGPDCPAVLAFQRMLERQIRRLAVVDEEDEIMGMVTDRDLRSVAFASLIGRDLGALRPAADDFLVGDLMSREVISVTPETDVREAALLMHNHKIGGLPVMVGRKAVGIITVHDLMEILVAALSGSALPENRRGGRESQEATGASG